MNTKKIIRAAIASIGVFLASSTLALAATITYPGNGGTGWGFPGGIQAHAVIIGNGTNPFSTTSPSTSGYVLTSNGAGSDPTFQAIVSGGTGTVSTSSSETATQVPYWTSTNGTPALLSGGNPGFTFNNAATRLTVTNASTTALTVGTGGLYLVSSANGTALATFNTANIITNQSFILPGSGGSLVTGTGSGGACAKWATSNSIVDAAFPCEVYPFTPATNYGIVSSATTSPLWGQAGIFASSTSAYPTLAVQQSGAGVAATFLGGNVGVGTTSPWALFSINPTAANGTAPSFVVGSTTGTRFVVTNSGNVGVGTSSPYQNLSVGGNLVVGASTAGGTLGDLFLPKLGVAAGSFIAVDPTGKVIATTTPSGGSGAAFPFTPATNFSVNMSATTTALWAQAGLYASSTTAYPTFAVRQAGTGPAATFDGGKVGIGTSTPFAQFSIAGDGVSSAFVISTSSNTQTPFRISLNGNVHMLNGAGIDIGNPGASGLGTSPPANGIIVSGNVGIGTTTPKGALGIQTIVNAINAFTVANSVGSTTLEADTIDTSGFILSVASSTNVGIQHYWGVDSKGHEISSATSSPTLSSCGTSPTIVGNDNNFEITVGSVAATSCTATFVWPWTNAPVCTVTEQTDSLANALSYTISTTQVVVSQTGLTSAKLDVVCKGYQ